MPLLRHQNVADDKSTRLSTILRPLLLFLAMSVLFNGLLILSTRHQEIALLESSARGDIARAFDDAHLVFRDIVSDVRILAESSTLRTFDFRDSLSLQQVERELLSFAKIKHWFDQVRFLDLSGMERVRVDWVTGQAQLVEQRRLQNKRSRYYVSETLGLKRDGIYVSPLDLNVERGAIEQPLKPMLRFGALVYDERGKPKGMLVLNYMAAELLRVFKDDSGYFPDIGALQLLNKEGFWLSAMRPGDEWGFMFSDRAERQFQNRYPETWQHMQAHADGRFSEAGRNFVFRKISPMAVRPRGQQAPSPIAAPSATTIIPDYYWFIVSEYTPPSLCSIALRADTLSYLGLSILLSVFAAMLLLARSLRQHYESMKHRAGDVARRAEKQIRPLSHAVEQSPVAVLFMNAQWGVEYVNSGYEKASGYSRDEIVGRRDFFFKLADASQALAEHLRHGLENGTAWIGEYQNRGKDGAYYWVRAHISPVAGDAVAGGQFLAIEEDISLQKVQEQQILHQANYDFLTDLPNRFLAMDRLEQMVKAAMRTEQSIALICLDVDNFKKFNDSLGHKVGDGILVEAAGRLRVGVRGGDTVARLGGDEFLIVVALGDSPGASRAIVQHAVSLFEEQFVIEGHELAVTCSAGVSLFPSDTRQPVELLQCAEMAMYEAKREGRNTYKYYASSMNEGLARRMRVEERLRGALSRGELQLHYQPIVDLRSSIPIAAEALLRWQDEELGQVSPAEFVPIAEQGDLIVEIGAFVLREALRQAVRFRRSLGEGFYVSVNVSPPQLRRVDFCASLAAMLSDAGLPGEGLVVELTEGVLLEKDALLASVFDDLGRMGVRVSMDDFGTGYSSLSYLRSHPFSVIKIDQEFIRDLATDEANQELVQASLQMAKALGLGVVAEGIETEAERALLLHWGCTQGQGYLFSPPKAAADFGVELSQRREVGA